MNELLSIDSDIIIGVFQYLAEHNRKNGTNDSPQSLLTIISTILLNRSRLACVCCQWSIILSNIKTFSLASLHFHVFGCSGAATEIFARYAVLNECHSVACSREAFLFIPTIVDFFKLPWRLRVAKFDILSQRPDSFNREIFEVELAQMQNFFSPQTVALVKRAFAEFPSGARVLSRWPQASQQYSNTVYELVNFRSGCQHGVAPDEFVALFRDSKFYTWQHLVHEDGAHCTVRIMGCEVIAQLTSALCFSPQTNREVKGTCIFTFQNQSFGTIMRVFIGSRLDLVLDFTTIPNL